MHSPVFFCWNKTLARPRFIWVIHQELCSIRKLQAELFCVVHPLDGAYPGNAHHCLSLAARPSSQGARADEFVALEAPVANGKSIFWHQVYTLAVI